MQTAHKRTKATTKETLEHVTFRVSKEDTERCLALASRLSAQTGVPISLSQAVRAAVQKGLDAYDSEQKGKKK